MTSHASELTLRRMFAQEAVAADVKAHAEECEQCRTRLKAIEEEQRRFEAAIPFERFAAGVERAGRNPRQVGAAPQRSWMRYAMAIAASVIVVAAVPLLMPHERHHNGIKGDIKGSPRVDIVVAGPANGPQRNTNLATPEALTPGEHVRIGYHAGNYHYLAVVSVDEHGEISIISDGALQNAEGYLPNSLEFTGAGLERMIVVMSRDALSEDELRRAVRTRFDEARGNLNQLGTLDVPGEQFHQLFVKP
jgi:hypothetical protein